MTEHAALLKIGELAQRAGLSVRALHHYDAIGLLSPSVRSASGARRYGQQDLIRLHRIQALKQLGYALPDIRASLDDASMDPFGPKIGQAMAHARTALFAKYLTLRQTAEVRRRQLAAMAELDAWPRLMASVRTHLLEGTPAEAPAMRALMQRWRQLYRDSNCGDDATLEAGVRSAFAHEPDLMLGVGVDDALMRHVREAQNVSGQTTASP